LTLRNRRRLLKDLAQQLGENERGKVEKNSVGIQMLATHPKKKIKIEIVIRTVARLNVRLF